MRYFVGHDLGTGRNKAVLVDERGVVHATAHASYPLAHPGKDRAEQDPGDFWRAVCICTHELLRGAEVYPTDVAAVGFAGQMLSLVPMASATEPSRPAISWMDARADEEARRIARRLGGRSVVVALAGAAPTAKDIVCKVAWLKKHEPAVFERTCAFLDATGYLVARATGRLVVDPTGAASTGLAHGLEWSRFLAMLIGFPLEKMPELVPSTQIVGGLMNDAARDLGLPEGTPVIAGMADIPAAAVGSGATAVGDAHVYLGTSGWIGATVRKPRNVPSAGIVSVTGPDPAFHLAIGEMETAGAAADWAAQLLGLSGDAHSAFEALASAAEPGAQGLLFAPWLFGERSPVTDALVRGAFVGLSLGHRREHLARAVYEGVGHNLRWILDELGGAGEPCPTLRAVGGGAQGDGFLQVIADVTGRPVERVERPEFAGAAGMALAAAVGVGVLPGLAAIKPLVRVDRVFVPRTTDAAVHNAQHEAYRMLAGPLGAIGRKLRTP